MDGNRSKTPGRVSSFGLARGTEVRSNYRVTLPSDLDELSAAALKKLVIQLLGEVADLKRPNAELRAEIARLKGLKTRPTLKPSGMDKATDRLGAMQREKRRGRGKVRPRAGVFNALN